MVLVHRASHALVTPVHHVVSSWRLKRQVVVLLLAESRGLKFRMPLGVLGEMIAAHEAFFAVRASKVLLARVSAIVAGQLIRSREALPTTGPITSERSLTCVDKEKH